jgi:ketosteroid isomerase-like protein
MTRESDERAILDRERQALDEWAAGNPMAYVEMDADDVSYFDDFGAQDRIDGITDMRSYFKAYTGKISRHRYEILNERVQLYGDVGILTMRYQPYDAHDKPNPAWKATSVYRRNGTDWLLVHAHWSMVKEANY